VSANKAAPIVKSGSVGHRITHVVQPPISDRISSTDGCLIPFPTWSDDRKRGRRGAGDSPDGIGHRERIAGGIAGADIGYSQGSGLRAGDIAAVAEICAVLSPAVNQSRTTGSQSL